MSFITRYFRFRDHDEDEDAVSCFWVRMGVGVDWLDTFVEVDPQFDDGALLSPSL